MKTRKLAEIRKHFPKFADCAHTVAGVLLQRWGALAWRAIGEEIREALIAKEVLSVVVTWNRGGADFAKIDLADFHSAVRYACGVEVFDE